MKITFALVVLACVLLAPVSADDLSCRYDSDCPSWAPCCNSYNTCYNHFPCTLSHIYFGEEAIYGGPEPPKLTAEEKWKNINRNIDFFWGVEEKDPR